MRASTNVGSVTTALCLMAVVIRPPAIAATVAPLSSASSLSPWGTNTAARTRVNSNLLCDIRGGGLFNKKSSSQIYRESLEEQVVLLNEKLRQAREEVTTLRENAKKRQESIASSRGANRAKAKEEKLSKDEARAMKQQEKEEGKLEKERQKEQKEMLQRLQNEIKQLDQMKGELEKLLETSTKKIEALEEELKSQESLTAELEASYKQKIVDLEQKLSEVQAAQLEKLKDLHQKKIDAAVQEALKAQEAEFLSKMEETTLRLTKEHAKAMEQEKLRSSKAVETERKKMRKLVRALALREKKLKLQDTKAESIAAEDEITAKTQTTATVRTGSSFANPIKPPTGRGTI